MEKTVGFVAKNAEAKSNEERVGLFGGEVWGSIGDFLW